MINMAEAQDLSGLGGMLNGFRDMVKEDKKITFVGTPGFCTPFALFLGFPVRDKELAFVPNLNIDGTRALVATEYGLELGGPASAAADALVILGGMAMPKIGVTLEEIEAFLKVVEHKKLIGVCFMGIFDKAGWCQRLKYDMLMNVDLRGEIARY